MKRFRDYALFLAWTVSLIGVIVSLYFGEILQIEPCRLCWYQRAFLFPLVVILGIAAYKDDKKITIYALPLALLGALFALYQTLGHWFPFLLNSSVCGQGKECGAPIFFILGFVSFPLFSAIGFILIAGLLFLSQKK